MKKIKRHILIAIDYNNPFANKLYIIDDYGTHRIVRFGLMKSSAIPFSKRVERFDWRKREETALELIAAKLKHGYKNNLHFKKNLL
jgi:hypothetical protein